MFDRFVSRLRREARATGQRRLLVLAGSRAATAAAVPDVLAAADLDPDRVTVLSDRNLDGVPATHVPLARSSTLLGTTRDAVVLDCHDETRPNAIGRASGVVDGGGLLVLLTPPLSAWPDRRDGFDESLAVPPFGVEEVGSAFRERLVETLLAHRGVGVWDADTGTVVRDGLVRPAPALEPAAPELPADPRFPTAAYEACLTDDQVATLEALEALWDPETAVVVSADRGRGKSSAAGLAAGALALDGRSVLVTAPGYRNAAEVFARAEELIEAAGALAGVDDRSVTTEGGGSVRFVRPDAAASEAADADALVVDEAAALPVRRLESFLAGETPVAFTTTVHGYEGTGRGFDVRFRERLADSGRCVESVTMTTPIRYAAGDPVEVWAFRALLLDARPPVDPLVEDATPADCSYSTLRTADLLADENRLREAFGLLVLAHYRTEPADLARLLDAPNVTVRALTHEGHVVAVALLAREGGLAAATRTRVYEGGRIRGNMLPDVLTSQLRDETAGKAVGVRVLRITTHHAVRSRGLGSRLLDEVAAEFEGATWADREVDYLGVGYGATPELLRFWTENGFGTVHLSTTRNEASGEHSALMMRPLTEAGQDLHDRSVAFFLRRIPAVLADALRAADPDVVRGTLAAADGPVPLDLTDREWRVVAAAAFGPGLYDAAPGPFRRLALRALVDGAVPPEAARLLVAKTLQARRWEPVADELGYVSPRAAKRTFGDVYQPLVDRYGNEAALEEAARYR